MSRFFSFFSLSADFLPFFAIFSFRLAGAAWMFKAVASAAIVESTADDLGAMAKSATTN